AINTEHLADGAVTAYKMSAAEDGSNEGMVPVGDANGNFTYQQIDGSIIDAKNLTSTNTVLEITGGEGATLVDAQIDFADAGEDKVLVTDDEGNVTWVDQSEVGEILEAENGLTKENLVIKLGGTLIEETTITTDATNTLAIAGLEPGTISDKLIVTETDGTLRQMKAAMPKFFYMPAVIFDTSVQGSFTRNLHEEYEAQF